MDYLPVFLNLKNQPCLVVGGGELAEGKISLLLKAGADIKVVAPKLSTSLAALENKGKFSYSSEAFVESMLDGCKLVIAATDDEQLRETVSTLAKEKNTPVNVVDCPKLCSFTMPSIIDRSPVLIAVSTGGASPTLARIIRAKLEAMLPQSYGRLATLINEFREQGKSSSRSREERRRFCLNSKTKKANLANRFHKRR